MPSDYLLEIEGIKGESTDRIHKGAIEIESWSFGASNPTASVEGADFSELRFIHKFDKATPLLYRACATGKHIPKAVLYGRRSATDTVDYYKVTLEEVVVSSYQSSADGGDLAAAAGEFKFAQVEVVYTPTPGGAGLSSGPMDDVDDDGVP